MEEGGRGGEGGRREGAFGTRGGWRGLTQTRYRWGCGLGWQLDAAAAPSRLKVSDEKGSSLPAPPPLTASLPQPSSSVSHSCTSAPRPELLLSKSVASFSSPSPPPSAAPVLGRFSSWGTSAPSGPNKQSRAKSRAGLQSGAQLEAVAMAFLSCWQRISRVRDSSSRSLQVLHTSTGSYSCWSGMGSFRWQQSLQNTLPQFLQW